MLDRRHEIEGIPDLARPRLDHRNDSEPEEALLFRESHGDADGLGRPLDLRWLPVACPFGPRVGSSEVSPTFERKSGLENENLIEDKIKDPTAFCTIVDRTNELEGLPDLAAIRQLRTD
jgi:hypothetical protein